MAGLLDIPGFNPADFAVSDEERKRLLLGNILLGISAGALNSNKGNQIGALGSGMLQGAQMGQRALSDAQAAKLDQLKAASGFMDIASKKQAYMDDQAYRDVAQNFKMPAPVQDMSPTPANAAALANAPKPGVYEQLNAFADALQQKGLGKEAEKYRLLAEKYKPEFDTTPRYGVDPATGERIAYTLDKSGNMKRLPVAPDLEKAYMADSGNRAAIPLDPFTGKPRGEGITKALTPGEVQSGQLGWANFGLSKNADQRAAAAAARANEVKPQFDATTGQFVYPPSPDAPSGRAVKPEGYTPKPPEHTRRELDSIDAQLGIIAGAKEAAKKTPSAFSMTRGMATMAGPISESVAGRFDSQEARAARSYVFNVVSAAINERAGTAQSVQELARLRSFLPAETDNAEQVEDKLTAFESYLHDKRKAYAGAGPAKTVNFADLPK